MRPVRNDMHHATIMCVMVSATFNAGVRRRKVLGALFIVTIGIGWYVADGSRNFFRAQTSNDSLCDPRFCGNGLLDPGEQCDDGNGTADDGCDPLCRLECDVDGDCPSGECAGGICTNLCGNGKVEPPLCVSSGGGFDCPPARPGDMKFVNLPGGEYPSVHAAGDFNRDGRLDVVVANYLGEVLSTGENGRKVYRGTIEIFLNKGGGAFENRREIGTMQWNEGGGDRGLDVLDVDQDGDDDVLVYDEKDRGIVLLRNDNLSFVRVIVKPMTYAYHLTHGDIQKDGDPDLGVVGFSLRGGGVSPDDVQGNDVLPGMPGAVFDRPVWMGVGSFQNTMKFADMDGDGDQDIVKVNRFSSETVPFGYSVRTYVSNGNGTFAEPVTMLERGGVPQVMQLVIGDVNNDGNMDVVVGEAPSFNAVAILGDGRGGARSHVVVPLPFTPLLLTLADPTVDGKLDIVFGAGQGSEGRNLWHAAGNGDGTFAAPVKFVTLSPPPSGLPHFTWTSAYFYNYDLRAADFDGDGLLDLSMVHSLYSNSATIILFRSSVDACTEISPTITCSQGEECDDGSSNGKSGKCTSRCTYCGNGVVDTINGVPEECDDGVRNGAPDSACTFRCTTVTQACDESSPGAMCTPPGQCTGVTGGACGSGQVWCCPEEEEDEDPKHTACVGEQCVIVSGAGTNECTDAAECTGTSHLACTGVGSCTIVQGPGRDLCSLANANEDCCDPADPACSHNQCDFFAETCDVVTGPGLLQCSVDTQCTEYHFSCSNQQCAIFPGDGPDTCGSALDCAPTCNLDGQCSADESCQCLDCFDAPRCNECNGNAVCDNGESCACNDCADEPACMPHLECDVESRQCTVVLGPGTNTCQSAEDCAGDELHLECRNMACTLVSGPGLDLCGTDDDCCDPADPQCRHRQCNPFTQSCIDVPGPALDQCGNGNDCTAFHSVCDDNACVMVEGEGPSECLDASMCQSDALCPNGVLDDGEQCDDGNTNDSDQCTNKCVLRCVDDAFCPCDESVGLCTNKCGNGVLELGEECDEGEDNRTDVPDDPTLWYCKAVTCTISACFDGNDNDYDMLPDAADAGCYRYNVSGSRTPQGGSFLGFLLAQTSPLSPIPPEEYLPGKDNESCPVDTVDRGSFCALTCDPGELCPGGTLCPEDGVCPILCPNGAIDDGEQCDDGNLVDSDLCSNICRLEECTGVWCPYCGDGIQQEEIGEQCDDGNEEDADSCTNNCRIRCDGDEDCEGTCDIVTHQCLPPLCGDGETNQPWERCDDGNIVNNDLCNNQCQPTCNADADCESGRCDQEQQVCKPLCGNGFVDSQEQCDDGNTIDDDRCTNQCIRHCSDDATCDCDEEKGVCRPPCGNGRIDFGESCDDGNTIDRDACSNRCQVRCRAGTLCPDRQACPQNGVCPAPGICGDGLVNQNSEQCDDGNQGNDDRCTTSCRVRCLQNEECPNGLVCLGEQCAECTNSLQCENGFCVDGRCRPALPLCGNGVVESGEACDDANSDDADGCTLRCLFPRGHACSASAQCQTLLCQDNVCSACAGEGECGSGMRCAEGNCLFGTVQCGDGVKQAAESCDDANFNDQDGCTSACVLPFGEACTNAAQCASAVCGDGLCAPCRTDAECASGARCAIGLCVTDGQMAYIPNICGNGQREEGESCDDGNARYGDGCTPFCRIGDGLGRQNVAANVSVRLPFSVEASLHAGAGSALADTGPATVAVMAAGAAAGVAWVRRRVRRRRG